MRRLLRLKRWMQSREIGFAGLVCGGRALRGRGAGNKPATVNAAMQIRRKLDTIPPLPRIAAVLRTPMTRIRIKLIGSPALGTAAVTTWWRNCGFFGAKHRQKSALR
jgi:hypothetical protein